LWVTLIGVTPSLGTVAADYESAVKPILQKHCAECHGSITQKAELNLLSLVTLARGSESGAVLKPGQPNDSKLWQMIEKNKMPAEDNPPLSNDEKQTIRRWIDSGAGAELQALHLSSEPEVTEHLVQSILFRRCTMCHGQQYQEGGLDLRTHASILKGGESGAAIVPGDPDGSLLIQKMVGGEMPPEESHSAAGIEPMPEAEQEILRMWIAAGAPVSTVGPDIADGRSDPLVSDEDRAFWSFQPPVRPSVPEVDSDRIRNTIDAFVIERLLDSGLEMNPEADRLTLIRRAAYDLTGLPPTPKQVDTYLNDDSPTAYESMIDRLLASPRYGERWSRFWLDLAGYADSEGKRSADMVRTYAWRYRDYVIRAFNADKPYDRFLIEQLAGDELVNHENIERFTEEQVDTLAATGFLRMAPDGTTANPVNRIEDRLEVIADELDILGRAVMGLTFKCARCHSHKYDPIPQRDYYRLAAVFKGAYDEFDWMTPQTFTNQWNKAKQRQLVAMTAKEETRWKADLERAQTLLKKLQAERDALQDQQNADKDAGKKANTKLANQIKAANKKVSTQKAALPKPPQIRALWDRGQPSPTFILKRGDPASPGRVVGPGVPSALSDGRTPFEYRKPFEDGSQTGMRLAFARWLTQTGHPLTARVFVNRVWHQHFGRGRGIVTSLDDFGRNGAAPTHPELLDWLATEFTRRDWSVKELHRLIMTSAVYRQSSRISPNHERLDPDNELYARMPMRRLDAEQMRDSLLAVAGRLDTRPYGPPDTVTVRGDGMVTSKAVTGQQRRRSVYLRQRRSQLPTILESFDLPQMNPNCTTRVASNIVSQPLHLLNNGLVHELAGAFAQRLQTEAPDDRGAQIELAYRLALGRIPDNEESAAAHDALDLLHTHWQDTPPTGDSEPASPEALALADFTHMLLNTAAFLYID
jgi:hypothetical protein